MPESLRVTLWNIDSFTARKHELQEFLPRLEIDVVALQETRLAENMRTLRSRDTWFTGKIEIGEEEE
ncbi:hypothetical protein NQ315_015245 [Exocentrus adspersus]|uniref:Endonuclease/exonuclease/phosphatase domain-containing protein n=1 Tax=Exocentrus adspersus TaxID=1586481 RepID=A0AAV8VAC6_9CUCU|nr:hypothetical protein NQ315_015245 [Exocentrus adspersus]